MSQSAYKAIATGLGSGLSPKAPGTIGSLACLALWYLLFSFLLFPSPSLQLTIFFCTLAIGIYCCTKYLAELSCDAERSTADPQEIVIDEWAGLLLTLVGCWPSNYLIILCAFALFRFFDIMKPWPIKRIEKLPGAWGIMLDDVLAGLYAFIVLRVFVSYGLN